MTDSKAVRKLRALLPHWMNHNAEHAAEFLKWARKAGKASVYIEAAAQHCAEANFMLRLAWEELGGPLGIEAEVEHEYPMTHRG
jgi:hypothetical protein